MSAGLFVAAAIVSGTAVAQAIGQGHGPPAPIAVPRTATAGASAAPDAIGGPPVAPAGVGGNQRGIDPDAAYKLSQAAIGRKIGDYAFLDRDGHQVRLADYRGKPVIVNFVYTGCLSACPIATRRVADAIERSRRTLGTGGFHVLTIGFNPPADAPESMRDFARRFGLESPNWSFLAAFEQQIHALAAEMGFQFAATAWGFDHLTQLTVLDADGRVYRQVYGEEFELRRLIDPLKELITGEPVPVDTVNDLVERVRILCTVYDPNTGAYRLNYTIIAQVIGISLAGITLIFYIVYEWRGRRRAAARENAAARALATSPLAGRPHASGAP